jgi:hypothetical protein
MRRWPVAFHINNSLKEIIMLLRRRSREKHGNSLFFTPQVLAAPAVKRHERAGLEGVIKKYTCLISLNFPAGNPLQKRTAV